MKKLKVSAILLSSVLLTACGGGSGGGSPPNLTFPTNAVLAEANQVNGEKVAKASVSKSASSNLNSVGDSSGTNSSLIAHNVSNILSEHIKDLPRFNALNAVNPFNQPCGASGSYSGSVNTDNGAYTITFNDCMNNSVDTIKGSMSGTVIVLNNDAEKLSNTSLKITSTLSISKNGVTYSTMQTGSSMDMEYSVAGSTSDNVIVTISAVGVENNQKYGCEECVFYIKILTNKDIQIYQTKGKLYIGDNLGAYVNYDTSYNMSSTPFVFSSSDGKVNAGGIAKYKSKDGKIIEIRTVSGEADLYIDGVYSARITL